MDIRQHDGYSVGMKKPAKVRPIDIARDEVILAAIAYNRLLRQTMVNPDLKTQWNDAHLRLLAAVDALEQIKVPEPVAC